MVNLGDSIPTVELTEGNPGGKVNLATELASGDGVIIGVPAAFSKIHLRAGSRYSCICAVETGLTSTGPTCSDNHVPGYVAHPKLKGAGKVFVVSVNDAFV